MPEKAAEYFANQIIIAESSGYAAASQNLKANR